MKNLLEIILTIAVALRVGWAQWQDRPRRGHAGPKGEYCEH
jgi:hypothetical protein